MNEQADGCQPTRRSATSSETTAANRAWWDADCTAYQAEHGAFLGDARFIWGPEGLDEADLALLGKVDGQRVLEIGCGAGQCGRWLVTQGAQVVGIDLSGNQLRHSGVLDRRTGVPVPVCQADAERLPFTDGVFDLVCSAYGALPFVAHAREALSEVARVLRPGGRLVFSVSHPIRWCFLDHPGQEGLLAVHPYFDRRAYVEQDGHGVARYIEHHRTMGDWVRAIRQAGLLVDDVIEPEWPAGNDASWDGWSPLRGRVIPGTAIFSGHRPSTPDPASQ